MSILTIEAQKQLTELTEEQRTSIRTRIGIRVAIYPFIVENGFIYFLRGEELVCVKLQEKNGVFVLLFENQIIEFDCSTGNCFIFSFTRNCLEYFSVGEHYLNTTRNLLYPFLYNLLIQKRINKVSGRPISSLRVFFTQNKVVGHLERAGSSTLNRPDNCLSLYEMICGIKEFMFEQFTASFMRGLNFFQPVVQKSKQSQSPLSVAGKYGVGMFLTASFDWKKLPRYAMISMLMMRLSVCSGKKMTGTFTQTVAMKFIHKLFDSTHRILCPTSTQNPIGLINNTDEMENLIQNYRMKGILEIEGFKSIPDCLQEMNQIIQKRKDSLKRNHDERFKEYGRLEEEKLQREASIQEFRDGIKRVKTDFQKTIQNQMVLDEICEEMSP
jgi:hypothetical protein